MPGLGDSTNFAWKVAAVLDHPELDELLTTFDVERSAFARALVSTTDGAFQRLTDRGWLGWFIRSGFVPHVLPWLTYFFDLSPKMYDGASQLAIEYPDSPLSVNVGSGGTLHAGERFPWVPDPKLVSGETLKSTHVALEQVGWHAFVFGSAPFVEASLNNREVPFHVFEWSADAKNKGLGKDVVYVVRPDGHIGLLLAKQGEEGLKAVDEYMTKWGVRGWNKK